MQKVFTRKTSQKLRITTPAGEVIYIRLAHVINMHGARIGVEASDGTEVVELEQAEKQEQFGGTLGTFFGDDWR